MARLTDPEIFSQYQAALREWGCTGYIKWRRRAEEWIGENLADQNIKSIAKLMWQHVEAGGEIDQVREQRPEFAGCFEFHYDLRFAIWRVYNLRGDGIAGHKHRTGNHRGKYSLELAFMNRIKPYPRGCALCAEETVVHALIPHVTTVTHDGQPFAVSLDALAVDRCSRCGEVYFTNESSDQISAAVRSQLGLLQKDEILQRTSELGITQEALAGRLGVSLDTIEAWIDGLQIQSRAMDNLMRLFFAYPQVREALPANGPSPCLGLAANPPSTGAAAIASPGSP